MATLVSALGLTYEEEECLREALELYMEHESSLAQVPASDEGDELSRLINDARRIQGINPKDADTKLAAGHSVNFVAAKALLKKLFTEGA